MKNNSVDRRGRLALPFAFVMFLCLMPLAGAQDAAPSEEELRSAYCIPVVEQQIQSERNMVTVVESIHKERTKDEQGLLSRSHKHLILLTSVLDRLQSVVRPRVPFTTGSPLFLSQERGIEDIAAYFAMNNRCANQCYSAGKSIDKCESDCQDSALIARVKVCFALSVLPPKDAIE